MKKMLFSIPESGWWLIAVATTVLFVIGMRMLGTGMKLPEELQNTVKRPSKRAKWTAYLLTPVGLGAILATNLIRPEPTPSILFLYSVACVSVPVALLPVRGRMLKDYIAQQQNPDVKIKPDRLTVAWVVCSLSTVILVAVLALMMTPYGMRK
ncbi:glycosyltransferase [Streptomyces sp. NBRC 110611]|uniref:hypothetical protein n=1 Tax=Streptomyces sp. NBRC 110611 TaxID=1621259 RepID=UPI0008567197|nr:hypothetical protein [Streptomyces sp. NBRC 110611]GAU70637.1 glycosyltransferase [Streptomyces sp. NBRC 110611]